MSGHGFLPGTASLVEEVDKKLLVTLRDGRKLVGILRSFDQFANIVLDECVERIYVKDMYGEIPLGVYIIRGENVVLLGELDLDRDARLPLRKVPASEIKALHRKEQEQRDAQDKQKRKMMLNRGFSLDPVDLAASLLRAGSNTHSEASTAMAAAAEFPAFCGRLGVSPAATESWWARLVALYPGPDRFYHTITHMDSLTELWREYRGQFSRADAVLAAIYFHDAVYDPKAPDNEEKSAELFRSFLMDAAGASNMKDVYDWILATKDHRKASISNSDLAFFLDMDLAILGYSRDVYAEYAKNIRREYIHVPEPVYRTKRAEILRNFREADDLFRTSLRDRFARNARENLQWEIELLGSARPLL